MSEALEEEDIVFAQNQIDDEIQKVRPPSKKKHEEELDKLICHIREKEGELDKIKTAGSLNITGELKNLKAEKSTTITRRKLIDAELEKLKKVIPEKMCQLGQLESSLIYKSEEKINLAIQRLEYNLNVQHFKLAEEKKIVSEIDRLKRSKKTLVQYLALKQETSGIRDLQRHMREERDTYFQVVGKLNSDEDKLRKNSNAAKTTFSVLKLQIDELYENKRQLVANYKKQHDEYQDVKEKQRKGSWKKREDYRKSYNADKRKQQAELEVEKAPFEKHLNWCNSLIKVLSRYNSLSVQEPSLDSLSPASSVDDPEPAEEIDDGQYVLLKKGAESQDYPQTTKRPSKKNRRPRKQSSIKKITLSSDMVQQLTELGLKAPNSVSEVAEAIVNLKLKKVLLEQEQHSIEVASDAGISATESMICEMSRQASKTESYEGAVETYPGDQVYVDLLRGCQEGHSDLPEGWETKGAVGGYESHPEVVSSNSNSTVEIDMGSGEGQVSVPENRDELNCDLNTFSLSISKIEGKVKRVETYADKSKPGILALNIKRVKSPQSIQIQRNMPPYEQNKEVVVADTGSLNPHRNDSMNNSGYRLQPQSEGHMQVANQWRKGEKPTSLCIPPLSSPAVQQSISLTLPLDFPSLTTAVSPGVVSSPVGNRSICSPSTGHLFSTCLVNSLPVSAPCTKPHQTLASRLSYPSCTTSVVGQVQQFLPLQKQLSQPVLILDSDDFPPLSQSIGLPRKGSNLSTRSSGSSSQQEHQLQSSDQQSILHTANQITSLDSQTHAQNAFLAGQSHSDPVNEELPSSHLMLQKSTGASLKCVKPLSMSQIPTVDKLSTEKWVESSVAFVKDFSPVHCEDKASTTLTECTRL